MNARSITNKSVNTDTLYVYRLVCLPISVSLSSAQGSVSTIMKLLSSRVRSGQGVKDKDRQGNQLSEATYFRSSR